MAHAGVRGIYSTRKVPLFGPIPIDGAGCQLNQTFELLRGAEAPSVGIGPN